MDAASAEAVDAFLVRLDACIAADQGFSVILDDPAGEDLIPIIDNVNKTMLVQSQILSDYRTHYSC